MAIIKPFKGYLYNPEKIKHLDSVMSPPYDVISPSEQASLYRKSPYNAVRLILRKEKSPYKYTNAAKAFNSWIRKKILIRDRTPAIYIYLQRYAHSSRKIDRLGFISLMKIEGSSNKGVLPHEETHASPREDRFNLIKKVKGNLSPIFSLYQDQSRSISKALKAFIEKNKPLIDVRIDGVTHKVWRLDDKKKIGFIASRMRGKKIFIADGHHRYEAARMYRDWMRQKGIRQKPLDYIMAYFTNLSDEPGLTILPTHRLIKNIGDLKPEDIVARLKEKCLADKCKNLNELLRRLQRQKGKGHCFGFYGGGLFCFLATKGKDTSRFRKLDVSVLHKFIIETVLGLKDLEGNIKYVREPRNVVKFVDRGAYKIAFFLRPVEIAQLKNMALGGEMMPQKSTYFYPKLLTGLVINKF